MVLPLEDSRRKALPIASGVVHFFPLALAEVAKRSALGQAQYKVTTAHMTWDRSISSNHMDSMMRHMIDAGPVGSSEQRIEHLAALAWRALACLQTACEERDTHERANESQ